MDVTDGQQKLNKPAETDKKKKKKNKEPKAAASSASNTSSNGVVNGTTNNEGWQPTDQNKDGAAGTFDVSQYLKKLQLKGSPQFQFWKTQPVPGIDEKIETGVNEAIEGDKQKSEIKKEPYNLPAGFHWDTLDLKNQNTLQSLYQLLNENYVEDDDNMFRFDYSQDFLRWALMPPGWKEVWHVGVKVTKTGKLIGFISAVPANIRIYDKKQQMVEINFLCVHKMLRSKRLAPVLIKEITRRVNLTGIFQAVYTAGVMLPLPVSSCRYWHRNLNPKKLIDVKFSHLGKNMTMQRTLKLFKLPSQPQTPGFRRVTKKDLPQCRDLLHKYLQQFHLFPEFSLPEFTHWFLPKENVVDSYVVENNGTITDFASFYTLPSTVMHHPVHNCLKAAYSFYNVSTVTPWKNLMKDALISAKNCNYDVFNALDLMENKAFLEELKFGQGDGNLQYYMYNWKCTPMPPEKVALVLH